MLLQNENENENEGDRGANQFRSFVGTASVVEAEEDGEEVTDGGDRCSVGLVVAMMVAAAAMMG